MSYRVTTLSLDREDNKKLKKLTKKGFKIIEIFRAGMALLTDGGNYGK